MWSLMTDVCREMGVRTDIPFKDLTDEEKDIVYHGPAEKKHIFYKAKKSNQAGELDFTYYNAVYTVENALAKVKDVYKRQFKWWQLCRCVPLWCMYRKCQCFFRRTGNKKGSTCIDGCK